MILKAIAMLWLMLLISAEYRGLSFGRRLYERGNELCRQHNFVHFSWRANSPLSSMQTNLSPAEYLESVLKKIYDPI